MFSRWEVVTTLPYPQAGGPPLIGCPRVLILYIRSCPPYWRSFVHPQRKDAPCCGYKDPLITWEASYDYYKSWTVDFVKVTNRACFYFEKQIVFQIMSKLQMCFYIFSLPWVRLVLLIQRSSCVMYDLWIVVQWQEVIFFSKASRLGLGTTQPLIHRILEVSFIDGKVTMAWSWPLTAV